MIDRPDGPAVEAFASRACYYCCEGMCSLRDMNVTLPTLFSIFVTFDLYGENLALSLIIAKELDGLRLFIMVLSTLF